MRTDTTIYFRHHSFVVINWCMLKNRSEGRSQAIFRTVPSAHQVHHPHLRMFEEFELRTPLSLKSLFRSRDPHNEEPGKAVVSRVAGVL